MDQLRQIKQLLPRRVGRIPFRNLIRAIALAALAVMGLLFISEYPVFFHTVGSLAPDKHWPGLDGISHIVFFGDSYTSVSFNVTLEQPSAQNPFGNPAFPGSAVAKRPNWADFLISYYNRTFIDAVDLAWGGATVDKEIVPQFLKNIRSMKMQVGEYLTKYANSPSYFPWQSGNTLFVFWIGINDINKVWLWPDGMEAMDADIASYARLVDQVYQTGARNFLFLNTPPIERSPETLSFIPEYQDKKTTFVTAWNMKTARLAPNLSTTYSDTTVFQYDAYKAYSQVLDDPCSHPETCGIKNVTGFCPSYMELSEAKALTSWDIFHEECTYPIHQYFWVDQLHHTYRMHNVTAKGVFDILSATENNMYP